MAENEPQVKTVNPGEKTIRGGPGDVSEGPATNRGCTDILCLILFLAHWGLFCYVAGLGFQKGDARKVVYPTDSLGRVCGLMNDQTPELTLGAAYPINMGPFIHVAYTFNVTEMFGPAVESLICSGVVPNTAFTAALNSAGVCGSTTPCFQNWQRACEEKLPGAGIDVQQFVANPVGEMKTFLEGSGGESPLQKIQKYVVSSCVSNCAAINAFSAPNATNTSAREWALDFDNDILWAEAWHNIINNSAAVGAFSTFQSLKVKALPESVCPYPTRYCLYFPGTKLSETGGRCVLSMQSLTKAASAALDSGLAKQVEGVIGDAAGQMARTYEVFIIVAVVVLVIGVVFLIILRHFVGCFVWLAIIATFLGLVGLGAYTLWMARFACQGSTFSAAEVANLGLATGQCDGLFREPDVQKRDLYFYLSIGAGVIALLYLFFVLCNCKRIRLAIGLNKVAARFVYCNKKIIFVPVVQILVAVIWWALWIVCALYAISNTTARFNKINLDAPYTWCAANGAYAGSDCGNTAALVGKCTGVWPAAPVWKDINLPSCSCSGNATCDTGALRCYRCGPPRFDMEPPDGWPFWFLLFSLLWNNAVLVAIGQMTIAGAVGVWYFNQNDMSGKHPVATGLRNCFRYHLGSIAFGSFILAVVQLVKWWLRYMQKQMEAQKQGFLAKVAGALAYCVLCFERCIKFLNKNAYIRIALVGENFCRAAWRAFQLIIRNMGRYAVLGGLGAIISRLGMLFIAISGTCLGYFIFVALYPEENPWFCVAIYFVMGYVGGKLVMNVFGLAVDSVLVCFITDEEINDGDAKNTPQELQDFLDK